MTTAARLGRADLAFASLNDFAQNAQMVANIDLRVPLIADADTGFGSHRPILLGWSRCIIKVVSLAFILNTQWPTSDVDI